MSTSAIPLGAVGVGSGGGVQMSSYAIFHRRAKVREGFCPYTVATHGLLAITISTRILFFKCSSENKNRWGTRNHNKSLWVTLFVVPPSLHVWICIFVQNDDIYCF